MSGQRRCLWVEQKSVQFIELQGLTYSGRRRKVNARRHSAELLQNEVIWCFDELVDFFDLVETFRQIIFADVEVVPNFQAIARRRHVVVIRVVAAAAILQVLTPHAPPNHRCRRAESEFSFFFSS